MRRQASEADITPSQLHAESSLTLDPPVIHQARDTHVLLGAPVTEKNKEGPDEVPEEQRPADRASQPAPSSPARRGMAEAAIAAELAAELLQAMGRDGLAVLAGACDKG